MKHLVVSGGERLHGEVHIQGAKNSVLPILAATVLHGGVSVLEACPHLSDVETAVNILEYLGAKTSWQGHTLRVDAGRLSRCAVPESLMRQMRSSVIFLGALLARFGEAELFYPGGCELGPRPIDLHISALKKLGAEICEDGGYLHCSTPSGICGNEISLSFPSVGATENIILACAISNGKTVIHNAAREPEISDLADFLNAAGARIYGCGSDTVVIHGVKRLGGVVHNIIPDRIVAATYMAAAAITGGSITLNNVMPSHLVSVIGVFRDAGCNVCVQGKSMRIEAPQRLCRVPTVRTLVHPGFPTDAGPVIVAMLTRACGTTVFVENIFQSRFRYIDELKRLGAHIKTEGSVAVVEGVDALSGAACECTDLRGGAALVVAGLAANGTTVVDKIHHIKRGYDDIAARLSALGADIKEEEVP